MAAITPFAEPTNFEEYKRWLSETRSYDIARGEREYQVIQEAFRKALIASPIWKQISGALNDLAQSYYVKTGLDLFHNQEIASPDINLKNYDSYLEKTFRYTFIKGEDAGTSSDARPVPSYYYNRIDDTLRTLIVVKFLDGVEFLIKKLDVICASEGQPGRVQYKCNDEGYFAAHYYFSTHVKALLADGEIFEKEMPFEIQITTQLQEVLRRFLHFQYEKDRNSLKATEVPWQWRYRENEFFTNYLGHMLRSIEGQIMDARRRRNIADACTE